MRAVDMAVLQFFWGCIPYLHDFNVEVECFTSQRVVEVGSDVFVTDFGHHEG